MKARGKIRTFPFSIAKRLLLAVLENGLPQHCLFVCLRSGFRIWLKLRTTSASRKNGTLWRLGLHFPAISMGLWCHRCVLERRHQPALQVQAPARRTCRQLILNAFCQAIFCQKTHKSFLLESLFCQAESPFWQKASSVRKHVDIKRSQIPRSQHEFVFHCRLFFFSNLFFFGLSLFRFRYHNYLVRFGQQNYMVRLR